MSPCHLWSISSSLLSPSTALLRTVTALLRRVASRLRALWACVIALLLGSLLILCPCRSALAAEVAEPSVSDVALSVYKTIVGGAISNGQQRFKLGEDLAWRWYNADASKRDKIPLTPISPYVGRLTDYDNYEQWRVAMIGNSLLLFAYDFAPLEGNGYWDVDTPNASIEYAKWYDWFEGTAPGGGNDGLLDGLSNTVALSGTEGVYLPVLGSYPDNAVSVASSPVTLSLTDSQIAALRKLADGFGCKYVAFLLCCNVTSYYQYPAGNYLYRSPLYKSYVVFSDSPISVSVTNPRLLGNLIPAFDVSVSSSGKLYSSSYSNGIYTSSAFSSSIEPNYSYWQWSDYYVSDNPYIYSSLDNNYGMLITGLWSSVSDGLSGPSEPVYPTVPQPDTPQPPVVTAPTTPVIVHPGNDTTTTTVDLQPILDAIRILNDNLTASIDGLVSALESCCESMRAMLDAWFRYYGDWLDMIWEELRTVNRWLEGIYFKTGGGSSSKPDYTAQPDDSLTWLDELLGRLFESLPDGLQDILTTLAELRGVFPFSIPWDIGIMLGLFAADPVAPVFDLPYPYGWVDGVPVYATLHIDLSGWEPAAYLCRRGLLILFGGWLAWNTKRLLGLVEVD